MRTIALMNQKGGVGKTTTTANLGAALAEMGKSVCLVDVDPQAHLTINYGVEPGKNVPSLYTALIDDQPLVQVAQQLDENIWLIPSSIDLAAADIELVSVLGRETLLKKRFEEWGKSFDYVLLDCPPSLGLLSINALAAASEVIIPMQPHFLALQGVGKLLETINLVRRLMNPPLRVSGIILTMFDAQTKLSNEIVSDVQSFIQSAHGKGLPWSNAHVFQTKIRRNIKLAESPSFGQTILKYEPNSNGAADYRALAKEIDAPAITPAPPAVIQPAPMPTPSPIPPAPEPAIAGEKPPLIPNSPAPAKSPRPRATLVKRGSINVAQIDPAKLAAAHVSEKIDMPNANLEAPTESKKVG